MLYIFATFCIITNRVWGLNDAELFRTEPKNIVCLEFFFGSEGSVQKFTHHLRIANVIHNIVL